MAKKIIDMKPYYIGGKPKWIDVKKFLKGRRILIHVNDNDVMRKNPPTGIIAGFLDHAAPIEYFKDDKDIRYEILILVNLDHPVDLIDYNGKKIHLESIILRTSDIYDTFKELIETGKTEFCDFSIDGFAKGVNPWDINLDWINEVFAGNIFTIAKEVDIEIIE